MATFYYKNGYKAKMGVGAVVPSPAILTDTEFDFGLDWEPVTYNSASGSWLGSDREVSGAIPKAVNMSSTFSIANNTPTTAIYNNLHLTIEYICNSWWSNWRSLNSVQLDNVTIPPNSSITISNSCNITDKSCISSMVYSNHPEQHPEYNTLSNTSISIKFTLRNGGTVLGYGIQSDTNFNFIIPPIYDCRAFVEHWTGKYAELSVNQKTLDNISPTTSPDVTEVYIQYFNDWGYGVSHGTGANVHIYMPEVKIETSDGILFNENSFDFTPKEETSKKPGVIKSSAAISSLCNYIRENEIVDYFSLNWRSYVRNPYKKGELPLGALVLLDGGYCYTVTNNNGSGYYDSNWYSFDDSEHTLVIKPANSVKTFSIDSINTDIKYKLQNPVKLGCYYTQYTAPIVTIKYTAGWGAKKIVFTPLDGFYNMEAVTVNLPTPATDTTTGTLVITQTDFYPDSFVGESNSKRINIGVTATCTDIKKSVTRNYITTLYKFVNLEILSMDGYRCKSTGEKYNKGDYITANLSWKSNSMDGNNPTSIHLTVEKLKTGEVIIDENFDVTGRNPWNWISDKEDIEEDSSYKVTVTIADQFRTRVAAINIGTKVVFIDWGIKPGCIGIGKYTEVGGLEIQFPTKFYNDVIFLTKGSEHMGEAAAHIPYTDTYGIGASNVQEALNWIYERLS